MTEPRKHIPIGSDVELVDLIEQDSGGGSSSVRLYQKVITYQDIDVVTGNMINQGLADVMTLDEGDVLVAAGTYVYTSFDDSGLTGEDGNLIDGTETGNNTILEPYFDMTNQASPTSGYAGVGNAGTWLGSVQGGFANPDQMNPGLPFVGGPGGSPLRLLVQAWNGDGNAGSLTLYLLVATPTDAP